MIKMGDDEFILYIRKNGFGQKRDNPELGRKIWDWLSKMTPTARQTKKGQDCLWGDTTSRIFDISILLLIFLNVPPSTVKACTGMSCRGFCPSALSSERRRGCGPGGESLCGSPLNPARRANDQAAPNKPRPGA